MNNQIEHFYYYLILFINYLIQILSIFKYDNHKINTYLCVYFTATIVKLIFAAIISFYAVFFAILLLYSKEVKKQIQKIIMFLKK